MIRYQPPVAAPLPFAAVAAGAGALLWEPGNARDALARWLRAHHGARRVLLTDSGTGALTLALIAAVRERPGPVALPAYACYDLATALVGADATCVFYDVDPATLAPERDSLAKALAAGARTVVIVHLYGVPVDVSALGLPGDVIVVDDAAQGVGARIHGRPLGGAGPLGVLSFGRGKGMTAGSGGALLANDEHGERLASSVQGRLLSPERGLRPVVALVGQGLLGGPAGYGFAARLPFLHLGETLYHEPSPVHELSAAGVAVLEETARRAEADLVVRKKNAERLLRGLAGSARFTAVTVPAGAEPGYLRLPLLHAAGMRDQVRRAAHLGVQPGYPAPLSVLPALTGRNRSTTSDFPGARTLAERLCTLPTHRFLAEGDLRRLEAWLRG